MFGVEIVEFEKIQCSFRLRKSFKQWKLVLFMCVRTPKMFSEIYFFFTFHQLEVIWEKIFKEKLSALLSSATGAFFPEMTISLFPLFRDFFVSFWRFLRQYKPCKEPLVIRLEMIRRTQMYFTSKNASKSWTSCRNNVSFPINYSPHPLFLEVNQVKAYIVCIANRQILRGRSRKLVFLQCLSIFFLTFFPIYISY